MGGNDIQSTRFCAWTYTIHHLHYFFLVIKNTEFVIYADNNTLYVENAIEDVALSSQDSSKKLFEWFADNQIQGNSDK